MESLTGEYQGPAVVILGGREVAVEAELQAWAGAPTHVDERGDMVHDLDEPTEPYWCGTLSITPDPEAPLQLPLPDDELLTLAVRLPSVEAAAELEAIHWTGEVMVLAVMGRGAAPF